MNNGKCSWVVLVNPGMEDEAVKAEFVRQRDAVEYMAPRLRWGGHLDMMKRLPDGTLTAEF